MERARARRRRHARRRRTALRRSPPTLRPSQGERRPVSKTMSRKAGKDHHMSFGYHMAAAAGIVCGVAAAGDVTVTFESIPGAFSANDMSPDGRWVVGDVDVNGDFFPDDGYIWDRLSDTFTVLPPLGFGAIAVSDDGAVVLGNIPDPGGVGSNVAARWTAATGWVSLGALPQANACPSLSDGYELSGDGSVAVGLSWDGCSGRGFVWDGTSRMQELEPLANGGNRASVISSDGTIIGGFAQGSFDRTPAVWDGGTTDGMLLDEPNGDVQGEVTGISDDGSVLLVEWLDASAGHTAARAATWTASRDIQIIGAGSLLPGWGGNPMDIADDGTIIGFDILMGNRRAWIQPQGQGPLILLEDYIESHGGVVDLDLGLHVPQAISADGRTIIGHTTFEGGWIIHIIPPCVGDATGDGLVNFDDLNLVLANWSQVVAQGEDGDVDGSGVVDFGDLNLVLAEWDSDCI
ncbi:MAG: hypothetical protein RIB58_04515 [Phycisphaerales bacterium]